MNSKQVEYNKYGNKLATSHSAYLYVRNELSFFPSYYTITFFSFIVKFRVNRLTTITDNERKSSPVSYHTFTIDTI